MLLRVMAPENKLPLISLLNAILSLDSPDQPPVQKKSRCQLTSIPG